MIWSGGFSRVSWHMFRLKPPLPLNDDSQNKEIWHQDDACADSNLLPDELGVFETGMGQAHEQAQITVAQMRQTAVIAYAKTVFEACNAAIVKLADTDFDKTYYGLFDYGYDPATGKVWATESKESLVAQDLVFHVTHGSRHMGMMEALRGLLGTAGTLSA